MSLKFNRPKSGYMNIVQNQMSLHAIVLGWTLLASGAHEARSVQPSTIACNDI